MPISDDKKYYPVNKLTYKPAPFVTGPYIKWPLVEVSFGDSAKGFTTLIDSGASNSMLNQEVALVHNIKIDKNKVYAGSGVGSTFKFWIAKDVDITVADHNFIFDFSVPVEDSAIPWPCILGHDSIFQVAKLEFTSFKEQFKIFFRKDRVKKF